MVFKERERLKDLGGVGISSQALPLRKVNTMVVPSTTGGMKNSVSSFGATTKSVKNIWLKS
jgi:hypothetical protein